MWRSVASNALTMFIIVLVVVAGIIAWGRQEFRGPGPLADAVCVRVERGDSLSKVSARLAEQGVISDARIFRIGADYSGQAEALKFGSYLVQPGASMGEVLGAMTQGGASTCGREVNLRIGVVAAEVQLRELDPATENFVEVVAFDPAGEVPTEYTEVADAPDLRFRVTLAEGVTSWQVVNALSQASFMAGEVADVPPEGSLSPGSYEVDRGGDRAALLAEMTAKQAATLAELWEARAGDLPYETPEEALIMASIVEKETGVASERPQVASVFVNRLRQGMRLQTDPTVIYGVTKGEGSLGRGLRQSELRRETPYNTYVIDGLPPTPIANPGRESIMAALNPDTTDFLYFVADGTGGHAFATTLEDHNRNVEKWRAIEAAAGQVDEGGVQGE
ncbi:endolytic transglycosylase MltG [Neogemmobacter tilapiae]|uniref:Endolytic murein transglycosylase n=1 Tax=Neogemmobacter tilapiae TaxID=875041 RepID=A0A918TF12_9RHOB|nr:endolytic transglycosylase MltG [Gemmobacter tilapiae]GHC46378.1 branched-chain alpha-keto acid dehydrogenase subunit E2 [Gemmobacter tilapiae]